MYKIVQHHKEIRISLGWTRRFVADIIKLARCHQLHHNVLKSAIFIQQGWPVIIKGTVWSVAPLQLVPEGGNQPEKRHLQMRKKKDASLKRGHLLTKMPKLTRHQKIKRDNINTGQKDVGQWEVPGSLPLLSSPCQWSRKERKDMTINLSCEWVSLGATSLPWAGGAFGWRSLIPANSASDLVKCPYHVLATF